MTLYWWVDLSPWWPVYISNTFVACLNYKVGSQPRPWFESLETWSLTTCKATPFSSHWRGDKLCNHWSLRGTDNMSCRGIDGQRVVYTTPGGWEYVCIAVWTGMGLNLWTVGVWQTNKCVCGSPTTVHTVRPCSEVSRLNNVNPFDSLLDFPTWSPIH